MLKHTCKPFYTKFAAECVKLGAEAMRRGYRETAAGHFDDARAEVNNAKRRHFLREGRKPIRTAGG